MSTSIDRREAVQRVGAFLGGLTLVGGRGLLDAVVRDAHARTAQVAASPAGVGEFTRADIAFLDEVADTMLPATKTPGARAAKTGAFMALMVTDSYEPRDQKIFREGMRTIDEESREAHGVEFTKATPQQRLTLLERLDREQKTYTDARELAMKTRTRAGEQTGEKPGAKTGDKYLPDQRKEQAASPDVNAAPAITADSPAHYFRMMKELALLGYFTSEIGCTKAQRYVESPGRFDPCMPYKKGDPAWAGHA